MDRNKRQKPKQSKPSVSIETGEEADRAFLEAMQDFDATAVPSKDRPEEQPAAKKRSSSASGQPDFVVDLHGYTLREAQNVVRARIETALATGTGTIHIRIITGKGRHSGEGGGVLAREVHAEVRRLFQRHIQRIDSAPSEVVVGNLPIRGHFDVWLRS